MNKIILVKLIVECHAPDVGLGLAAATLRHEVDVTPVLAPHGAEVVGRVIGELGEVRAVETGHADVRIIIGNGTALYLAAPHAQEPLPVGRDGRRGKVAPGLGDDALLHPGLIVDFPDFAVACRIGTDADERAFALHGIGVEALGIVGQEVVLHVVAPNAGAVVLLSREENQPHVRRINGRIILVCGGDLATDEAPVGRGLENLVGFPPRFREHNLLAIRRIGKIQHGGAVGFLYGRTLLGQVLDENVGRVVAEREIGYLAAIDRNVQNPVGEPSDAAPAPPHFGHADIIRRLRNLREVRPRLFRYGNHRVVNPLGRQRTVSTQHTQNNPTKQLPLAFHNPSFFVLNQPLSASATEAVCRKIFGCISSGEIHKGSTKVRKRLQKAKIKS